MIGGPDDTGDVSTTTTGAELPAEGTWFEPIQRTSRNVWTAIGGDLSAEDDLNEGIQDQFDDTPGGGVVDETVDTAFNLGPDWLDEAVVVAIVLVAIGALLWLARPLLEIGASLTEA